LLEYSRFADTAKLVRDANELFQFAEVFGTDFFDGWAKLKKNHIS
jgi:uncharacterized protein with von Willebrand factor type A (vWA) domain